MNSTIFIPNKLKVGYQNRSDTYTKKLAYVIYYDSTNKLRKQTSWESWRDKSIEPDEFDNVPTSGFVLNKKAGDYSGDWGNHRQAYCRVFDPRGFEFEITINNLLYVLENTSSIKGKGLEGDFVYGWEGTDLILIPTESPDYKRLKTYSEMLHAPESIKSSDLILGGTYKTNKDEDLIYLGRFSRYYYDGYRSNAPKNMGAHYFFQTPGGSLHLLKTLSRKIVKTVSSEPVPNYADLMDKLQEEESYCPWDPSKDVFVPMTKDEFEVQANRYYARNIWIKIGNEYKRMDIDRQFGKWKIPSYAMSSFGYAPNELLTTEEFIEKYQPNKRIQYLANGRKRKGNW
jgi:hypothetical protein